MSLKNLNIDKWNFDAKNFYVDSSDSYIKTYPVFLKYFHEIDKIEEQHLVIASHFVYGWMPTIITLNLSSKNEVLRLLNKAKQGAVLNNQELEILKICVNNSLVGLSKLLHFINPHDYAIWDSRIFRYLTEKKSIYGIGNTQSYSEYLLGLKDISRDENFKSEFVNIEEMIGYPITAMRAIEIVMFETDKRNQLEISN